MDSPILGMDMAKTSSYPQHQATPFVGLPSVRVDVRNGTARPALYDITGEEFLIGSVPGCDLRLPGTNLPPVDASSRGNSMAFACDGSRQPCPSSSMASRSRRRHPPI